MAGNDTAIFQFTPGETQASGFLEVHQQMRVQVIAGSHKITPQRLQKLTVVAQSPREVNRSQSANRKRGARSN